MCSIDIEKINCDVTAEVAQKQLIGLGFLMIQTHVRVGNPVIHCEKH